MPQDFSNISFTSFLWPDVKKQHQEASGLEKMSPQVFINWGDIGIITQFRELRDEIAALKQKIEKLGEKQQIIPIQFLESEKLILKQPIVVSLSYSPENKIWLADCPELNLYGTGRDESEAINDFKIALEESYFSLKKDKDKLGPKLEKEWRIFTKIIEEK